MQDESRDQAPKARGQSPISTPPMIVGRSERQHFVATTEKMRALIFKVLGG
jgi:hypothetical protein